MAEEFPNIPGYTIDKRLGQGGMATVYLATQESFGRPVALKIMSDKLSEEDNVWAKRFIHEAKVVAQLSHPNIVPVFDVGTYEGRFFISMECMKGGDLEGKMAKGITIPEVLKIIAGVAAGLDFAGEKGFVHRDIKPDNVMFREDGSPVILDFGIVKQKGGGDGDKMTQTGTIVGTTAYMSPEQAQGKELDERSDIYSLGIMFYELLMGRTPFQGDSAVAVLLKHVNEPPPPLPPHLAALQPVMDKTLAKKPEDRYDRARDMIEHLKELEPQLKEIVIQQQQMLSTPTSADDATAIQGAVDTGAQTVATGALQVESQATKETEITDVLNSAQATIQDHSEESRAKKAKRSKQFFIAASVVVVLALSFVGYQQLYVAPMERAAAEEKLRVAQQKRVQKIQDLHASAKEASKEVRYTDTDAMDKLIIIYREILGLDPEDKQSLATLEKFGASYIKLANAALDAEDLTNAEKYRNYAESLAPKNPELVTLRDNIQELRGESESEALASQMQQQQIDILLTDARQDIADGKTFSPTGDNAYETLQRVLAINPQEPNALSLTEQMLEDLYKDTGAKIDSGSLRTAQNNLDILERYYGDKSRLANLQDSYDRAAKRARERDAAASITRKKEDLLLQASRLSREKQSVSVNDQMREIYLKVLDIDSSNREAQNGLSRTSDFEVQMARDFIKQHEFGRAEQNIALIERYTPTYASLSSIKSELKQARKTAEQMQGYISKAENLINKSGTPESRRNELKQALGYLETVWQLDRENPGFTSSMTQLETEYILILNELVASKNKTLADAYFADTNGKPWPSDRILQLQLAQQSANQKSKPKPKRVLTGGF